MDNPDASNEAKVSVHSDIEVGTGPLAQVTLLAAGDSSEQIYDDWAATYESDLVRNGYLSPALCVDALAAAVGDADLTSLAVVEYGCGTGLVGAELASRGVTDVTGVDLSRGMLDIAAAKRVYRELIQADLTTEIELANDRFEACLCVGSMGNGHLAPSHIAEMLRPVRSGSPIVFYMNALPYRDDDYAWQFARLEDDGVWAIERIEESNYMASLDRPGYMIVARSL